MTISSLKDQAPKEVDLETFKPTFVPKKKKDATMKDESHDKVQI